MRKKWIIVGLVLVLLAAAGWGGSVIYAAVQNNAAPSELALSTPNNSSDSTVEAATLDPSGLAGTWAIGADSQAGYRVAEVLNGQNVTVVGRTSEVTGELTIDGTMLTAAQITVNMTNIATDDSGRDNQFHGILSTSKYPTASFTLTQPVDVAALAGGDSGVADIDVTGSLTIAGVTQQVTVPMQAQATSSGVEVQGSVPITFSDYGISAPNLGFVKVEDHGAVEMLLNLSK